MEKKQIHLIATGTGQSKSNQSTERTENSSTLKRAASTANDSFEAPETKRKRRSTSMDDLPVEIIDVILKNVPTSDLLNCRQINHRWNRISSEIMQQRADIKLQFVFEDGEFMHLIHYRHCEALLIDSCKSLARTDGKSLTDLVVCLAKALHFPFTSFRFDNLSNFWNSDIRCFLAFWGKNVVSLTVDNVGVRGMDFGELQKIVFDRVPNLKELGIGKVDYYSRRAVIHPSEFHLPLLEVLRVHENYENHLIEDLLRAAENLKNFTEDGHISVSILESLQSLNKLHCLQQAKIFVSKELIDIWENLPSIVNLKLQSLVLTFHPSIWKNSRLKSSAEAITSQLFHASKDVMQTLSTEALGSFTGLKIQRLRKLLKLHIEFGSLEDPDTIFPPSLDVTDSFPNLKELEIEDMRNLDSFISNQFQLPNVEVLKTSFYGFSNSEFVFEFNENFMKITPNVRTLLIVADSSFDPEHTVLVDFKKISKNWPKLENFGWQIDATVQSNLLHKLDAVITGISENLCKELSEKFRSKNHLSASELAMYQLEHIKTPILAMKELKRLDIHFMFDVSNYCRNREFGLSDILCERGYNGPLDDAGFCKDSVFFETGFSKVSKFLGFDQMPNLKVRIHKTIDD